MRTTKAIINDIIAFFRDNESVFCDAIEELDSCNGYLDGDRRYSMNEFNDIMSGADLLEIAFKVAYGCDGDSGTTNSTFNPRSEYFYFNGYANLVSTNYKDYSDYLDEYAVQGMITNRAEINTIDDEPELAALFDELEAAKEG